MGKRVGIYVCTNVFRSKTEDERKKRIRDIWIRMINHIEKTKSDIH